MPIISFGLPSLFLTSCYPYDHEVRPVQPVIGRSYYRPDSESFVLKAIPLDVNPLPVSAAQPEDEGVLTRSPTQADADPFRKELAERLESLINNLSQAVESSPLDRSGIDNIDTQYSDTQLFLKKTPVPLEDDEKIMALISKAKELRIQFLRINDL